MDAGHYIDSWQALTAHMIVFLTFFAMSSIITQGQRGRWAPNNLQAGTVHSGRVHLGVQNTRYKWWDNPALIIIITTFCQGLRRDVDTEVAYRDSHLFLHFLANFAINLDKSLPGRRKYVPIQVPPTYSTPEPMQISNAKTADSDTTNEEFYHIRETRPPKFL